VSVFVLNISKISDKNIEITQRKALKIKHLQKINNARGVRSFLAQKKHYFVPIFIIYFGQNKIRNKNKSSIYFYSQNYIIFAVENLSPIICFLATKKD
jgi:hypothetical protein